MESRKKYFQFFSSGNDLSFNAMENLDELRESAQKMIIAHIQFPKLLIAVVNGPCIGIAPTIVALCDVVYASDTVNAFQNVNYVNQI